MIDCKEIIDLLLEDEEDEDADLVKEVSPVTPQDVQNWLISAGFKDMDGSWVKFMSAQAISVSKLPEDFYSLSYYRWSGEGWVFSHRYESNGPGLIDTLSQVVDVPVQESEEDFADDDESAFEFKDALGAEDKHEIYSMLDQGILGVSGNVSRHSSHYVHENSTTYEWQWEWYWSDSETDEQREEQKVIEERTERQLTDLEAEITKDMRRWNRKIYKEIEAAYDDHLSDEQVAENIRANEYDFEEDGTRENGGGFQYDQLSPKAQTKAREWWVNTELEMGDTYYAEPVIAEWKWLLKNKGFDGVEIAWSGFSSQGDGASFTASSVDLKRYLTGPDPIDFPERDREQLSENEEDDDEDIDPKDVYDVRRRNISAIRTKADYAEYEARVAEFFTEEGINNLTGITDNQGYTVQDEFSSRPCEVCHRPRMAGTRIHASGYSPKTREIKTYWICPDCEYYAAYGTLDDTTMMDLKDDPEEIREAEEDDVGDDTSDILGEPPPAPVFHIFSSHGDITALVDDGTVTEVRLNTPGDEDGESLNNIAKFDVGEWRKFYNIEQLEPNASIDILDLGYWLKDGTYEAAETDWRKEFARQRHERQKPIPGD